MSTHATSYRPVEAPLGLEPAVYDQALARAAQLSLPADCHAAPTHSRKERPAGKGAWLPQPALLRAYRRALVTAIQDGLTIVLAPCACVDGLNTYHAIPSVGCLREIARRQAPAQPIIASGQ